MKKHLIHEIEHIELLLSFEIINKRYLEVIHENRRFIL